MVVRVERGSPLLGNGIQYRTACGLGTESDYIHLRIQIIEE